MTNPKLILYHTQLLFDLSVNLKRIRRQIKMTQSELAVKTGLNKNFISGVECCRRNISLLSLVRLANGLRVHPNCLLRPTIKSRHHCRFCLK